MSDFESSKFTQKQDFCCKTGEIKMKEVDANAKDDV